MQVTQILRQAVSEQPDRLATVFEGRRRTWREIGARVPRMAAALRALGAGEGQCVAALAMNSDRFLELFFSIPWCGAAFAPLNVRWSVPENKFALRDAQAKILFVDQHFIAETVKLNEDGRLTLIYMGDEETPAGMLSYETLIADHAPIPDADSKQQAPFPQRRGLPVPQGEGGRCQQTEKAEAGENRPGSFGATG